MTTALDSRIIKTSDPSFIDEAIAVYKRGGVVIAPSTTNYILTCDATNAEAIDRVFEIKKRSRKASPLCVALPDVDALPAYVKLPEGFPQDAIDTLLPGEIVLIFDPNYEFPAQLFSGFSTIGITVSPDRDFGALVKAYGKPIVGTSANISGQGNIFVDLDKALADIGDGVDLILDGGPTVAAAFEDHKDRVNTIVDFTKGRPWLARTGFVPTEKVQAIFPDLNTDVDAYKAQLPKKN